MTDSFVDYTNVTELEKFTFKLGQLMKEISESSKEGTDEILVAVEDERLKVKDNADSRLNDHVDVVDRELLFRGVDFKLSRFRVKENLILKEIPHFRYDFPVAKCFDMGEFWLLECVEKGRVVSDATGRLLLGALIQQSTKMAVFVRIGDTFISEKFLGFMRNDDKMEYFETFPQSKNDDEFQIVSAQVVMEWLPNNLRITFPGFSGYFDSVHPIERIQVRCIWPQIPRGGLKFERDELQGAPIWLAEYEESEQSVPLRNTMLRSIQAAHLREVLFTPMGNTNLISIQVSREGKFPKTIATIESVWTIMAQIYRTETERLEKDLTIRFNFIPKRIMEAMRFERINEAFSLIWRRFMKSVERSWNELCPIQMTESLLFECSGEIGNSIKLINWCIERELEWQGLLKDHVLLRKLYKIPPRHIYTDSEKEKELLLTVDEKIEKLADKFDSGLEGFGNNKNMDEDAREFDEEFHDCHGEEIELKILEHGYDFKGHVIYEPVILNCEPPPNKILTKSLLKNPLAGDVIAMNQLREDMRVFKAWNEGICGIKCKLNEGGVLEFEFDGIAQPRGDFDVIDLGFVGFLVWHSPNDIELIDGRTVISQRMRDFEGHWLNLWKEVNDDSDDTEGKSANVPLNKRVSFNHRALLGQVMSDLMLKTDLRTLLEGATPFLTRKAAELIGSEAEEILKEEVSRAEAMNENYPLDKINNLLNAYEEKMTKSLTLAALCSDIFPLDSTTRTVLVSGEPQREFLLKDEHEFKVIRREIVGKDGEFREMMSGYEGIRIKL